MPAIREAGQAFEAGHRVPLVGEGRDAAARHPHPARPLRRQGTSRARFLCCAAQLASARG